MAPMSPSAAPGAPQAEGNPFPSMVLPSTRLRWMWLARGLGCQTPP